MEDRLRTGTDKTNAWMGNAWLPDGSNTSLFLPSPALLSMRRVPAGSFCMILSFLTFIPMSIHSLKWVVSILLSTEGPTKKKNSERSLITQQALEVENTRVPTPCKTSNMHQRSNNHRAISLSHWLSVLGGPKRLLMRERVFEPKGQMSKKNWLGGELGSRWEGERETGSHGYSRYSHGCYSCGFVSESINSDSYLSDVLKSPVFKSTPSLQPTQGSCCRLWVKPS